MLKLNKICLAAIVCIQCCSCYFILEKYFQSFILKYANIFYFVIVNANKFTGNFAIVAN